jgi:predicted MFS family arabinose efflux permease
MGKATTKGPSEPAVVILAIASGGAIACNYAIQPALVTIARGLHAKAEAVSQVPSAAMIGYLLGLVLLVPLVDRWRPDRLIPAQLACLALALSLAAVMPNLTALAICFVAVGAMTTVAAEATALVGKLGDSTARGARIGLIAAGISAGLLLSRLVGGALTGWLGWRSMLDCFALLSLIAAFVTRRVLPSQRIGVGRSYLYALRSIPRAFAAHPPLRRSTAAGMLWFLAFNLIWVGLSVRLAQPPYSDSPAAVGLYSLAGILGLGVTRIAGRASDRYGARPVITISLLLAATGAASLAAALGHPAWTVASLATFDAGCFGAQVANQMTVVTLDQDRSGTISSAYLVIYYAAGAAGTAIATPILAALGWHGLTLLAAAAVAASATVIAAQRRQPHQLSAVRGSDNRLPDESARA